VSKIESKPIISICIPTYNRGNVIGRLLESIVENLSGSPHIANYVEIVVSDNCSNDNTTNIIEQYKSKLLNFKYIKNSENLGYAKNINQAVEISSGQYCWLMGSDDILIKGSLKYLIHEVSSAKPDALIAGAISNGRTREFYGNTDFDIKIEKSLNKIISKSTELSSLFGFMSVLVVKKDFWISTQTTSDEESHPYTHTLRIFRGLAKGERHISYRKNPIVTTGSEPNEYNATLHKHLILDLKTYQYIFNTILPISPSNNTHLASLIKSQYTFFRMIFCRATASTEEWGEIVEILQKLGRQDVSPKQYGHDKYIAYIYKKMKFAKYKFGNLCKSH
jgi:abequosyltransferase